jgi:mRNA-degrading endonuclease RelE of RelBE toxin-antitoxin system
MSYRLRYDRRFLRQLESLPGDVRSVARQQIKILAETPRPPRAKE